LNKSNNEKQLEHYWFYFIVSKCWYWVLYFTHSLQKHTDVLELMKTTLQTMKE